MKSVRVDLFAFRSFLLFFRESLRLLWHRLRDVDARVLPKGAGEEGVGILADNLGPAQEENNILGFGL